MEIESSKRVNSLGILTITQLILAVKDSEVAGFSLNELKSEFHSRVKNRLYQYIRIFCQKNRYDESLSKEIFQKTVIKALGKIKEFEFNPAISELRVTNKLFAWLNKIAKNIFFDFLRQRKKIIYTDDSFEELVCEDIRPDEYDFDDSEETNVKLQEAWDDLDDREKLIFYYCIEYSCLDNNNHLPDDVIDDICRILRIKKGTIRVIKLRALKRLRSKFRHAKLN